MSAIGISSIGSSSASAVAQKGPSLAYKITRISLVPSLVILPALGALEQFRWDAGIVVDDAVGQQPRAFAPELLLKIGSDSQFAAVGIGDRAHKFVIGLAAVKRTGSVGRRTAAAAQCGRFSA
jgi:hypothetical protein